MTDPYHYSEPGAPALADFGQATMAASASPPSSSTSADQ